MSARGSLPRSFVPTNLRRAGRAPPRRRLPTAAFSRRTVASSFLSGTVGIGHRNGMWKPVLSLFVVLASAGSGAAVVAASAADELQRLEQAWHRCLREAYAHQPPGQSRAGDQRNALDECQGREDAYVAALVSAQGAEGPTRAQPPNRARGWAASVAAYMLDPITAWLGALTR